MCLRRTEQNKKKTINYKNQLLSELKAKHSVEVVVLGVEHKDINKKSKTYKPTKIFPQSST